MTRGKFITLEGGEGAGKTTQIRRLKEALEARGVEVVLTREPGGSKGAEAIRDLLVSGDADRWDGLTELMLFSAARRDHLVKTVWPAMERGCWAISDRFADSTMAYQGYARGLAPADIQQLYTLVAGDFRPNLTLVLDLPVAIGVARSKRRSTDADRFEKEDLSFHERLRQGFLTIAAGEPDRYAVIDANRDADHVHRAILTAVAGRLGLA